MRRFKYDVALSFAGEDRSCAEALNSALKARDIKVFYDKAEGPDLWGKDLFAHLHRVYCRDSKYCIFLVSEHYVRKSWTRHERQSAQERAMSQEDEYILPIRLDDTSVPGMPRTIAYLRWNEYTPDEMAAYVLQKLGRPDTPMEEGAARAIPTVEHRTPRKPIPRSVKTDQRYARHGRLSELLLPHRAEYGHFGLHSLAAHGTAISQKRLAATFLDLNKSYSESLTYAKPVVGIPSGYYRPYEISMTDADDIQTDITTCYSDGYVVTEGYLDLFCSGERSFNANFFIYKVQRHLQLSLEVLAGLTEELMLLVRFERLNQFQWSVYDRGSLRTQYPFRGPYQDIEIAVALAQIHGRDQWNIKMPVSQEILRQIALMFGLPGLPQAYWNNRGELLYSVGVEGR